MRDRLPRLIAWLLCRRPEILGDLAEERAGGRSRAWLWRQFASTFFPRRPRFPRETRFLTPFANDLCYAVRILLNNPGFAAVAILAVAVGVGVNAGIFMILNGAALKTLPAPASDSLVSIYQEIRGKTTRNSHGSETLVATSEYERYRDQNHVFAALAAYEPFLEVTLGGDQPQQLFGQLTSCNFFDVLAEPPALGRSFVAADCAPGNGAVAVIGDTLWRVRFAADPQIVGKKILLNRQLLTIVGVAPPRFTGSEVVAASVWVPLTMQKLLEPPLDFSHGDWSWLALLGRMKPGISLNQVRADLGVIAARIDLTDPGRATRLDVSIASYLGRPEERRAIKTVGALVFTAVALVLLIACANVANLLLARATGRRREIAIRISVGATRWRLVRQLLTESLLIAVLGGLAGTMIAISTFQSCAYFILSHLPRGAPQLTFDVSPDWRVLAYSVGLTVITGVVFGLAPALRASRRDVNSSLNSGGGFLRQVLVGLQVAISSILLVAAGLLLHGLWVTQRIDPGFEMNHVATISLNLRGQGYNIEQASAFQRQLRERLESLPGVTGAAQAHVTPLEESHNRSMFLAPGSTQELLIERNQVSPEFFSVLGIPIVRGRNFTEAETRGSVKVAIVTESTGRRLWPGEDPLGKTLRDADERAEREVIGVAKDAQVSSIGHSDTLYVYLPVSPDGQRQMQWMVRYGGTYAPAAAALRRAVHSIDPALLITVAPLEDNLELRRLLSRISSALAGSLGILALLLASTGIYAVVAFTVSRRVREIGIRIALGAERRAVVTMILRQAVKPIAIGAALGIGGCAAVSKILSSMLFGVSEYDPAAFLGVTLLIACVALAACYVPARRAVKVDPMVALRCE